MLITNITYPDLVELTINTTQRHLHQKHLKMAEKSSLRCSMRYWLLDYSLSRKASSAELVASHWQTLTDELENLARIDPDNRESVQHDRSTELRVHECHAIDEVVNEQPHDGENQSGGVGGFGEATPVLGEGRTEKAEGGDGYGPQPGDR